MGQWPDLLGRHAGLFSFVLAILCFFDVPAPSLDGLLLAPLFFICIFFSATMFPFCQFIFFPRTSAEQGRFLVWSVADTCVVRRRCRRHSRGCPAPDTAGRAQRGRRGI